MPKTFKGLTVTLARAPCHLTIAVALITSEIPYINGILSSEVFVSKLSISTKEAVLKLSYILISSCELGLSLSIKSTTQELTSFARVVLVDVVKLVLKFTFEGLVVLECASELAARSEA